ncbi:Uncharacterised protein [uncultured archaeon]|nr:Uncharacterised protein [uncultured archaeon]
MTSKITLRGRHISQFAQNYLLERKSQLELKGIYGDDGAKSFCQTYNLIENEPNTPVEIVEGIDSICAGAGADECPKFKTNCVFSDGFNEDSETLREYGLKTGQYTASDIIEAVIDYNNRTGFVSPRDKFRKRKIGGTSI